MSGKTRHYEKVVFNLHKEEIVLGSTELEQPVKIIGYGTNVVSVASNENASSDKLYFSETEEVFDEDNTVSANECFCEGGGCVCEEVPTSWRTMDFDEEDRRFGDFPINRFQSAIQQVFGGPLKQTLAFNRNMDF